MAHQDIDLKNFKSNRGNAGFTDEERGKMTELLSAGFTDTFRWLYPEVTGAYSWWSYMYPCPGKERGLENRLFYRLRPPPRERIADSRILPEGDGQRPLPRGAGAERASDQDRTTGQAGPGRGGAASSWPGPWINWRPPGAARTSRRPPAFIPIGAGQCGKLDRGQRPSPSTLFFGGYPGAERTICLFLPDWQEPEDALALAMADEGPVKVLRCTHNADGGITHRDILGAILGQGITREKVGDLLVGPESCDVLVLEELADYLLLHLDSAGRTRLQDGTHFPLPDFSAEVRIKTIRDTVATPGWTPW